MILYIQTVTQSCEIILLDENGSFLKKKKWENIRHHSELVLRGIDEVLRGEKPEKILVMKGMGSYTGTRIGVSVANGLAFAWNIPIGGISTKEYVGDETSFDSTVYLEEFFKKPQWEKMIEPVYNREPRIG